MLEFKSAAVTREKGRVILEDKGLDCRLYFYCAGHDWTDGLLHLALHAELLVQF